MRAATPPASRPPPALRGLRRPPHRRPRRRPQDSVPRELLQLNLRELELSAHTCDGVACQLQLRIRQLSVDNMLMNTDSPVLLTSEPSAIKEGEGETPFLNIEVDRRARNMFHLFSVQVRLGPADAAPRAVAPTPTPPLRMIL